MSRRKGRVSSGCLVVQEASAREEDVASMLSAHVEAFPPSSAFTPSAFTTPTLTPPALTRPPHLRRRL